MAAKFQVKALMPKRVSSWQPALVRAVDGEPMIEVILNRQRVRVCPGYERDSRVWLFLKSCEEDGLEETIFYWEDIRKDWNRTQSLIFKGHRSR